MLVRKQPVCPPTIPALPRQGRTTTYAPDMTNTPENVIIGIDVAKDTLEAAFICQATGRLLHRQHLPNAAAGYRRLIASAQHYKHVHLVMEATGNYHLYLSEALAEANLTQSIINPLVIARFSQMKLRRTKTDKSDAVLIAAYGREQQPQPHRMNTEAQQQLKQIASVIEQLTKQRTALKNLRHAGSLLPRGARVCEDVLQHQIEEIDRNLKALEAEQERLAHEAFAAVDELARSVVGIGPRTAAALVAYAGDLSSFRTHKQLSAFVGLNPVAKQSGTSLNAQMHVSKQGHARLRTLLYMSAQWARRHNRDCRALYERLIAAGKRKKVALVAVANKLVRQLFGVIKSGMAFDNNYNMKTTTVA